MSKPLINFQLGWPSTSLFPAAHILQGATTVLTSPSKTASSLIYGPDGGYAPLREEIGKWLSKSYQPAEAITSDRICITNGASHNLENVLAKFTEPGYTRRIWMVEPSYFLACPIFSDAGFGDRLCGVPEDEEGLDIEFLRKGLKEVEAQEQPKKPTWKTDEKRYEKLYKHVIYAVPTFANPSGKTMSLRRREELVRVAREYDALVITDDVYDLLRWPSSPSADVSELGAIPPRIVDVDRTLDGGPQDKWGNSMSNGSFSKIVAPGVRTGWAEGQPALAFALSTLGATKSGGCPSFLTSTFIYEMLASNTLQDHIAKVLIPTYRKRYYAMLEAIEEKLAPLGYKVSTGKAYEETSGVHAAAVNGHAGEKKDDAYAAGGYFTYLTVPTGVKISVKDLAAKALEEQNVKFAFGAMMAVEGDETSDERAKEGYGRGIRLCWSWHEEEQIREGIERVAVLTKEVLGQ